MIVVPQAPALLVAVLMASVYAAAFCAWQCRSLHEVPTYWLAAGLGFALGQVAGDLLDLVPWTLGQVHILETSACSFLCLLGARWLVKRVRVQ